MPLELFNNFFLLLNLYMDEGIINDSILLLIMATSSVIKEAFLLLIRSMLADDLPIHFGQKIKGYGYPDLQSLRAIP